MIKILSYIIFVVFLSGCKDDYMECSSKENADIIDTIVKKQAITNTDNKQGILVELKDIATLSLNKDVGNRECSALLSLKEDDIVLQEAILYKVIKLEKSEYTHQVQIVNVDNFNTLIHNLNNKLNDKALVKKAKMAGFNNPIRYLQYTKAKENLSKLLSERDNLLELKKSNNIFQNSRIYNEENDFIEIIGFKYDHRNRGSMEITVKNKSKYPIVYYWNSYYLYDDNLNQKFSFKEYEENIQIPANSSKIVQYSVEKNGGYSLFTTDLLRLFAENSKLNLYVVPDTVTYKDNFGSNNQKFGKNRLANINKISSKQFNILDEKIKKTELEISSLEDKKQLTDYELGNR